MKRRGMRSTSMLLAALLACGWSLRAEQVVISEIMYHPRGDLPQRFKIFITRVSYQQYQRQRRKQQQPFDVR